MADINLKITIDDNFLANAVKKAMNDDPSFVQVVRCKDCKYNRGSNKCFHPSSILIVPDDDDYCSYGEPRDA